MAKVRGECLYCSARLPLYLKLKHADFCSEQHRTTYYDEQQRLALARLIETEKILNRARAGKLAAREAKGALTGREQKVIEGRRRVRQEDPPVAEPIVMLANRPRTGPQQLTVCKPVAACVRIAIPAGPRPDHSDFQSAASVDVPAQPSPIGASIEMLGLALSPADFGDRRQRVETVPELAVPPLAFPPFDSHLGRRRTQNPNLLPTGLPAVDGARTLECPAASIGLQPEPVLPAIPTRPPIELTLGAASVVSMPPLAVAGIRAVQCEAGFEPWRGGLQLPRHDARPGDPMLPRGSSAPDVYQPTAVDAPTASQGQDPTASHRGMTVEFPAETFELDPGGFHEIAPPDRTELPGPLSEPLAFPIPIPAQSVPHPMAISPSDDWPAPAPVCPANGSTRNGSPGLSLAAAVGSARPARADEQPTVRLAVVPDGFSDPGPPLKPQAGSEPDRSGTCAELEPPVARLVGLTGAPRPATYRENNKQRALGEETGPPPRTALPVSHWRPDPILQAGDADPLEAPPGPLGFECVTVPRSRDELPFPTAPPVPGPPLPRFKYPRFHVPDWLARWLRLRIALAALAVVILFGGGRWVTKKVSGSAAAPPAFSGIGASMQRSVSARAGVRFSDDFHSGLESWEGRDTPPVTWKVDDSGFLVPGELAIYRPTAKMKDYNLEFTGQVERKALSWAFRIQDTRNYYAMKLAITRPGPLPSLALERYAVIDGKELSRRINPISLTVRGQSMFKVRLDVKGPDFVVKIHNRIVDSWTDERIRSGGIGFFSGKGELGRISRVSIEYQYDLLGRFCALFARPPGAEVVR